MAKTQKTQSAFNIKHLLIDGDMLIYKIGYAAEATVMFADGTEYKDANLGVARRLISRRIQWYCRVFGLEFHPKNYTLYLSGKGNWRYDFFPEYKANRKTLTKPAGYHPLRQWMMDQPNCILVEDEEADDRLSVDCLPGQAIVTADKDFYTVPAYVYSVTAERLFQPTVPQGICFAMLQGLAGDRVDGYYGVDYIGKRKAEKYLTSCRGLTIGQAYLKLKRLLQKRGEDAWHQFRTCLSLASLRWPGEVGDRYIGPRRIFKYRHLPFELFLPYYRVDHNHKYGIIIEQGD